MPPVYGHRITFRITVVYDGPRDPVLDEMAREFWPANPNPMSITEAHDPDRHAFYCEKRELIRDKLVDRPDNIIGT